MVLQWVQKTWIAWLLITGLTVLIYAKTVSYEMLRNYDDDVYFKDSSISELNVPHIKAYFSDYYLGMYQPLPILSMAFLNSITPEEIKIQRWANILLHCINTLLVLLLIKKITGNKLVGIFTALFFAIHPMHVESVTWLAQEVT